MVFVQLLGEIPLFQCQFSNFLVRYRTRCSSRWRLDPYVGVARRQIGRDVRQHECLHGREPVLARYPQGNTLAEMFLAKYASKRLYQPSQSVSVVARDGDGLWVVLQVCRKRARERHRGREAEQVHRDSPRTNTQNTQGRMKLIMRALQGEIGASCNARRPQTSRATIGGMTELLLALKPASAIAMGKTRTGFSG